MADGAEMPNITGAPPRPSVFVYVPAYGNVLSTTTFNALMALCVTLHHEGIATAVLTASNPEISESRNMAATVWYDSIPMSHMLMVDADMGFEPRLVLDMLACNEPLVGTLYRKKMDDEIGWAGSGYPEDGNLTEVAGANLHASSFIEVEGVGGGVMLIRKDCITGILGKFQMLSDPHVHRHVAHDKELGERGIERIIRCFDPMYIPGRGRISEDIAFCIRHKMAGGKVWAAIGHEVSHIGIKNYRGSFLQHQLEVEAKSRLAIAPPQKEAAQ